MENSAKQEMQTKPCCCIAVVGALVVLFAWWKVTWGAIALTVLGVIIILKELIGQCCCSSACKSKLEDKKKG